MPSQPVRVAMWSGPRNISTAMMRAWENRPDSHVVDEPFYAYYLARTGIEHPGRDDVIGSQPTDWRVVAEELTRGPLPAGVSVYFQKHMTHHLLPEVDRGALDGLHHAFLIRDPAEVLVSYAKVRGEPTLDDVGLPQQVELFERYGGPVVDARDVLQHPEQTLRSLCEALGVEFLPAMLQWPAGPRATDGVWGPHWYDAVWASTGFTPYRPPSGEVPSALQPLLDRCRPLYETLSSHRLTA
jgi:sulfotransferase family protein